MIQSLILLSAILWHDIKKFFVNVKFIFIPSYWIMNYPYSHEWDSEFCMLLVNNKFTKDPQREYTV